MDANYLEKLTSALYRVTERMDDSEPLKWKLRKSALEFSEAYFEEPDLLSLDAEQRRRERINSTLRIILRLLQLASSTSYVARMNFEILFREYDAIAKELFGERDVALVSETASSPVSKEEQPPIHHKVAVRSLEPTLRQQKILEFLGTTERAGIAELAGFLGDTVSEKTLQRDLTELIAKGQVHADGERRWRLYSLAANK